MSNEDTPIEPVRPVEGDAPAPDYVPPPPPRPGRMFRLRSVIAVAAAGLVVGGLGGAAVTHLADGPDRSGDHRSFPDGPLPDGQGQLPGAPPTGQIPGVPRDDSEDPSSGSGGSSAS